MERWQIWENPATESAKKILGFIERQRPDEFKARNVLQAVNSFTTIAEIAEGRRQRGR